MKIVCYGDSNTFGYDGDAVMGGRFPEGRRWPDLLGQMLGCETVNCGLNGRRVPRFQRSIDADVALVQRCGDGAVVIVMLGSNDILAEAEAEDTAEHMRIFLEALRKAMPQSAIVLAAPLSLSAYGDEYARRSDELAEAFGQVAEELGLPFVNTASWQIPTSGDCVHFTERGHSLFALKMGQTLRALLR